MNNIKFISGDYFGNLYRLRKAKLDRLDRLNKELEKREFLGLSTTMCQVSIDQLENTLVDNLKKLLKADWVKCEKLGLIDGIDECEIQYLYETLILGD